MGNCSIQWGVEGTENQSSNSSLNELWNLHQLTSLNMQIKDASVFPRDLIAFAKLESYKILIGDGWKPAAVESGNYRVSRVLKLNLNMDSRMLIDYGIKLLMTRAEDLSLAELKGVREVLYELNDDGFSKLKHLSILNCGEMLSLIGSIEWAHRDHVFPNLESLILQNLSNMERICSGPLPAQAFTKLGVIKVKGCDRMEFVFPHSMIKHLSELHEIEVCECKSMTKIIAEKIQEEGDGETDKIEFLNMRSLTLECLPSLVSLSPENNGSSNQLLNDKVEFPNLETLKLYSINVPRIWDGKLSACCFQNLTSLTVDGCERLTYLFSHSVAGGLVKLQHLLISSCQSVEEIFIPDNNAGVVHLLHPRKSATTEEVPIFPELETLVITKMESLKTLWPSQVTQSSFCKLKKMEITSCANLLNLFPCYILNKLQSLESLDVSHCDSIEVVYEMESLSTEGKSEEGLEIPLRSLSLGHLPNLKSLWNKDPQGLIKLQNLNNVKVTRCSRLKHVFPLSVAKDLIQLQFLAIIECGVEEIVVSGQGGEEEASLGLVFPKLISLKFVNLPELRWFCDGNHNFRFPFLNKLYVVECPAMVTFSRGISRASILRKVCLTQNGDQWLWEGDINATLSKIFNRGSYAASEMSESLSEESTGF